MKPAILLYNPPASLDEEGRTPCIPLGILGICSLIDRSKLHISITQELPEKAYNEFEPNLDDAVCLAITCLTGLQILNALELAKKVRKKRPDITIIWGGYHPSATVEQCLENEFVDVVVRGYGEITFPEIVKRLANKQSYEDVEGISFVKDGAIVNNPDRPTLDFNDIPPMPYDLFDVEKYFRDTNSRMLTYTSSRSCPHQCGFCADYVMYKRRWNPLSAERVIADLTFLKKRYNYDTVRFYDSNFFASEERVRKICQGVIDNNLDFEWLKCNGDAFILCQYSPDTFDLMKKAGLSNILIGMESAYKPALDCITKTATVENNIEAVRRISEHGLTVAFSFMFGFPYDLPRDKMEEEHKKELTATMKLIAQFSDNYSRGDYYMMFCFTPYPGVRLFERYKELGWKPPASLEEWGSVNLFETSSCVWVSPRSIKRFNSCHRMLWFFTHKLERSIFAKSNNTALRKYAKFADAQARKMLKAKINKGKFSMPFILRITWLYYSAKRFIKRKTKS